MRQLNSSSISNIELVEGFFSLSNREALSFDYLPEETDVMVAKNDKKFFRITLKLVPFRFLLQRLLLVTLEQAPHYYSVTCMTLLTVVIEPLTLLVEKGKRNQAQLIEQVRLYKSLWYPLVVC
jgi:hypothetical protein